MEENDGQSDWGPTKIEQFIFLDHSVGGISLDDHCLVQKKEKALSRTDERQLGFAFFLPAGHDSDPYLSLYPHLWRADRIPQLQGQARHLGQ